MSPVEHAELDSITKPPMAVDAAIRSRRTIHQFLPTPISQDLIESAIEMARWAPNHKLTEPWRFYSLGPNTVVILADLNEALFMRDKPDEVVARKRARWIEMPSTTVVTCARSTDALRDKENYAATCCAIHNFSLYLWSRGIGTKWSTTKLIRHPEFYDVLGIDSGNEDVVGILWAGYPEVIPRQQRKPVNAIHRTFP